MRARTSLSGAFLLVAAAASSSCGGNARIVTPTAPAAAPSEPVAPQPEGQATLLPPTGRPWIAGTEPDGTRHVIVGSLRASLARGGGPSWAEHRFAAPIHVVVRVAGGWVFVATDGAVARSDAFTGPLERLGAVTGFEDRGARTLLGRLAALDEDAALWTTDGSRALERLLAPGDAPVLDAVFADAMHGAVVVDGGALFYTSDAGASWRQVELAGDAVLRLQAAGGRIVVSTLGSTRLLDDPGTLGAEASGNVAGAEPLGEDEVALLRDKLLRVEPALVDAWGVTRADGTALVALDRDLAVVERATGRIVERHRGHLPERCRLLGWGPHVAASCGAAGLYRIEQGVALIQVGAEAAPYQAVFSDDGLRYARAGACGNDDAPNHLCVLEPASLQPRTVQYQPGVELQLARAASMHASQVVVRGVTDVGERVFVVDVRTGESTPVRVSGSGEDDEDAPTVFDAWWTQDGSFVGLGGWQRWAEGPRVLLRGSSPTSLEPRPLPIGARRVAFLDATHGFAIGRHAGRLWQTIDAGERWVPLLAPIEGLPAALELNEHEADARCRFGACVVGSSMVLRAERAAAPERPALASSVRRRRRAPERGGVASREYFRGYECRLSGAPRTLPNLPRGSAPSSGVRSLGLAGAAGRARVDVWRAADGLLLQIAWRGEDTRGPFQGRTRPMPITGPDASADDLDAPSSAYVLRGVGRAGVLVERCGRGSGGCSLLWGGVEREPGPVDAGPMDGRTASLVHLELEQAVAAPEGGFLLSWRGYAAPGQLSVLEEIDARGQLARRRVLRWIGDRFAAVSGIASHEGRFGFVLEDVRQPGRLVHYPLEGPAVELPRIQDVRSFGPCGASAAAAPTTIWSTRYFVPRIRGQDDLRARLELSADGHVCVRDVESWLQRWSSAAGAAERGVRLRAEAGSRLEGSVDQGPSRQQLVCSPDRY